MTILVGTHTQLWADRRVTSQDGTVWRPDRKLTRADGIVAGFCGSSSSCEKAIRAVRAGERDPDALAAICSGLVVTHSGLWELSGIAVRVPRRIAYQTHGSGHAEAAAYIAGAGAVDDATIRRALKYVASCRWDCGDGIDTYELV